MENNIHIAQATPNLRSEAPAQQQSLIVSKPVSSSKITLSVKEGQQVDFTQIGQFQTEFTREGNTLVVRFSSGEILKLENFYHSNSDLPRAQSIRFEAGNLTAEEFAQLFPVPDGLAKPAEGEESNNIPNSNGQNQSDFSFETTPLESSTISTSGQDGIGFDHLPSYFSYHASNSALEPIALNGSLSGKENQIFSYNLLGIISDPDGGSITITDFHQTSGDPISFVRAGSQIIFDSSAFDALAEGEATEMTFSYTIYDGIFSASASILLTLFGENDAPIVTTIAAGQVTENTPPVSINLLDGQKDLDTSDILSARNISVTDNLGASVAFTNNNDGTISIDPTQYNHLAGDENRTLTVRYDVHDGHTGVANTASLVVTGVNDAPNASDDNFLGNGSDFRVNEVTDQGQFRPNITNLADGGFVVVWHSYDHLQGDISSPSANAQIFDRYGNPVGGEIRVNSLTSGRQEVPFPVALDNGGFAVVWQSNRPGQGDDDLTGIKARIFDDNGNELVSEFLVNDLVEGQQAAPWATPLENGHFVVVWQSNNASDDDSDGYGIRARIFNTAGQAVTSEFSINDYKDGDQTDAYVTGLSDGGFIVTWQSDDGQQGDTSGTAIKARIFDATGAPASAEIQVNSYVNSDQYQTRSTELDNGHIVVTWNSKDPQQGDNSSIGIKAVILDADGEVVIPEFLVNSLTNAEQSFSSIAALEGGRFIVTWQSYDPQQGDSSSLGVKGRIFDSSGNEIVPEFLVNEIANNQQANPSVTALDGGGFVVSWISSDAQLGDLSGFAINARMFDTLGNPIGRYNEDQSLTIDGKSLLVNDTDPDSSDTLSITAVSATSNKGASLRLNADATISYDPTNAPEIQALAEGEMLEDSFTYTISDGNGGTDTATVTLSIGGTNDAPTVTAINAGQITEDANSLTINLLAGQSDTDTSDTLSARNISVTDNLGASVAFTNNNDGTISITPGQYNHLAGDESRTLTIRYDVHDGNTGVANTANLVVTGSNDTPQAGNDVLPVTKEFIVNQKTQDHQVQPVTEAMPNGGFISVWIDRYSTGLNNVSLKARIFDKNNNPGNEFTLLDNLSGYTYSPSVAFLPSGKGIVTWRGDDKGISSAYAIMIERDGTLINADNSPLIKFYDTNYRSYFEWSVNVIALSADRFLVSWEDWEQYSDNSRIGIRAGIINQNGTLVDLDDKGGTSFLVNEFTAGDQVKHQIVTLTNGNTIAVWETSDKPQLGDNTDYSYTAISARLFDPNGTPLDPDGNGESEFTVNLKTDDYQRDPAVAALQHGGFVITWYTQNENDDEGSGGAVKARIFDAQGNGGAEFLVNDQEVHTQFLPEIAVLENGNFIVAWITGAYGNGWDLAAKIYEPDGTEVDGNGDGVSEFLVSDLVNNRDSHPSITALNDGGFVIMWSTHSHHDEDGDGSAIMARFFGADGQPRHGHSEDAVLIISASDLIANDIDPDTSDTLSITSVSATSTNGASMMLNGNGTISYDPTNATKIQFLAKGETLEDSFTYSVTDGNGGTNTATVTLTVEGRNDAPDAVDDHLNGDTAGSDSPTLTLDSAPTLISNPNDSLEQSSSIAIDKQGDRVLAVYAVKNATKLTGLYLDKDGKPVGDSIEFDLQLTGNLSAADIKVLDNGNVYIQWTDTGDNAVKGGVFAPDGTSLSPIHLFGHANDSRSDHNFDQAKDGSFVISAQLQGDNGSRVIKLYEMKIQADNSLNVQEKVIIDEANVDSYGDIAINEDGVIAVSWRNGSHLSNWWGSNGYVQLFNRDFSEISDPQRFDTSSGVRSPHIVALENGSFSITWVRYGSTWLDTPSRVLSADGTFKSDQEFVINSNLTGGQGIVDVAALANGGYVVQYAEDIIATPGGRNGPDNVALRYISNDGSILSNDLIFDRDGNQRYGQFVELEPGRLLVLFADSSDNFGVQDGYGVIAQIVELTGLNTPFANEDNTALIQAADLLANDTDPDSSDTLSITSVSATSANGAAITLTADGTISYNSANASTIQALAEGETLEDSFTYTISDGNGGTDSATVTLTIEGRNDAPTVIAINAGQLSEDAALLPINLLAGQTDTDTNDTLSIRNISVTDNLGTHVAFTNNNDGTISIDPTQYNHLANGENRTVTVRYDVHDGHTDVSNTASLIVTGTNDAPTVTAINAGQVTEDASPLSINLLAGQTDTDTSDTLSARNISVTDNLGASVTFTNNNDGTISIDPTQYNHLAGDESRTLTVRYDVHDEHIGVANTASLVVTGVNDAPTAVDEAVTTAEDSPITIDVLDGDRDVDGDSLTISAVTQGTNGTVSIDDNGTADNSADDKVIYTPDHDFVGSDQFTYTISDGNGGSATATVSVTVEPKADAPTGSLAPRALSHNPVAGLEFTANHGTADHQMSPDITTLSNGMVAATWTSNSAAIYTRLGTINADGEPVWNSSERGIVQTIMGDLRHPQVLEIEAGKLAYVWTNGNLITGRVIEVDHTGAILRIGSQFTVGTSSANSTTGPQITSLDNDTLAFLWQDDSGRSLNTRIGDLQNDLSVIFQQSGETQVNGYNSSRMDIQRILDLDNGDILYVWRSNATPGDGYFGGHSARIGTPNANGTITWKPADEIKINEVTDWDQSSAQPVQLADGRVLFTWAGYNPTDDYEIIARIGEIQADGSMNWPSTGEFVVNERSADYQFNHTALALSDGRVLFVWQSANSEGDTSSSGISARIGRPNDDGSIAWDPRGEFTVNQYTSGEQRQPQVTELDDGRIAFVWESYSSPSDGSARGISIRVFDIAERSFLEDQPLPINLTASLVDTDGSEYLSSILLGGYPAGSSFNLGTAAPDGSGWLIGEADISNLSTLIMTPPSDWNGTFTLTAKITATERSNGDSASTIVSSNFTITNVNDAPVVSAPLTSSADEGDQTYRLDLLEGASDADEGDSAALSISMTSSLPDGVTLDGSELVIDPTHTSFNNLGLNDSRDINLTYDINDGNGGSVTQTATITINGQNDAPTVQIIQSGSVTEDLNVSNGRLTTSGRLSISDPDTGESSFAAGTYTGSMGGTLTLASNGTWNYSINNSLAAVQNLAGGASAQDRFTLKTTDGTDYNHNVVINGADEEIILSFEENNFIFGEIQFSNGYGGMNWGNGGIVNTHAYGINSSGYHVAAGDSQYSIYMSGFSWTSSYFESQTGEKFDFEGAWFAGAWQDGLAVTVTGTLNGTSVATQSFVVNSTSRIFVDMNDSFNLVDRIQIDTVSGTENPNYNGSGKHLAIDDITVKWSGNLDPLLFDLSSTGIDLNNRTAHFDMNNDGEVERLSWASGSNGILVMDLNRTGSIENGSEVFSPWFDKGGYEDSLEALAIFDSNLDGQISEDDIRYDDLLIWQDANEDGISNEGELQSLSTHSISSINLSADHVSWTIDGQSVFASGQFTRNDGSKGQYVGVNLSTGTPASTSDRMVDVKDLDPDLLIDFAPDTNQLNLSSLLEGAFDGNQIDDFVQATEENGQTNLKVDRDGKGDQYDFEQVAKLEGVVAGDMLDISLDDQAALVQITVTAIAG
ncbi:MAG: cadherin-like domain-containing protein [Cohaesibacter sp.]|jgi:VCBS repeat-containing protein|nr:cadherin-like domain-containing protein [Cohaesibacter sp.]